MFDEWRGDLETRMRSGLEHPAIEAHLTKYKKLVPALALLIHLADTRGGLIGDESLGKAIRWAKYLESHARRIYGAAVKPDLGHDGEGLIAVGFGVNLRRESHPARQYTRAKHAHVSDKDSNFPKAGP